MDPKKASICTATCSLPPPTGEPCPVNGRSPGSVSTQHSSPRSDLTYVNSINAAQAPNTAAGNTAPTSDGTPTTKTQPSDVAISRKESEGFGFVIISSLNRPETAASNSESGDCFSGAFRVECVLMHNQLPSNMENRRLK